MKDDPFEIAVEHIAWCIAQGWTADDVFAAVGRDRPFRGGWSEAIWVVAFEQEALATPKTIRKAA